MKYRVCVVDKHYYYVDAESTDQAENIVADNLLNDTLDQLEEGACSISFDSIPCEGD